LIPPFEILIHTITFQAFIRFVFAACPIIEKVRRFGAILQCNCSALFIYCTIAIVFIISSHSYVFYYNKRYNIFQEKDKIFVIKMAAKKIDTAIYYSLQRR